MADTSRLSEDKRALLEKYLRGNLPQTAKAAEISAQRTIAEVSNTRARVVEVQVGGSKRPFFFLHGDWKGIAFFCFPLARELGSDQPFYALEPYQFNGLSVPPTVETMAAAHVKSMRSVQPEGPYLLGGWCNGGLVAYEIARQLHAVGQTIDLLVLMDPMYLGYRSRRRLVRQIINRLGNLIGLGLDKQLDWFLRLLRICKPLGFVMHPLLHVYSRLWKLRQESSQDSIRLIIHDVISFARQKLMTGIKSFVRLFEHKRVASQCINSHGPTAEALRQDYLGIFEWIDMDYMPTSLYPGKITFFWPGNEPWHTVSAGWRKVIEAKGAQEVEAHIIPGNQDTWRDKHLDVLAERLRMCLSKVQKEGA